MLCIYSDFHDPLWVYCDNVDSEKPSLPVSSAMENNVWMGGVIEDYLQNYMEAATPSLNVS